MRPHSANSKNCSNSYPKSTSHKKDKYSFYEEPRFLNLNINLLQTIEQSSKKIIQKSSYIFPENNVWNRFLSKTEDISSTKIKSPINKKSKIFEDKTESKSIGKRHINIDEFNKNLSKTTLKLDDPKVEKLKKTIFTNFSNKNDFFSIGFNNNYKTENKQEYIPYVKNKESEFSHLLLEYKMKKFEEKNNKIEKTKEFEKKISKEAVGKKPEFIRDLQKPTFYMFNKFGE